ncbi:MAG TPA: glycosyltransferase family A protein [Stellaceae bacterium]|nr:glycosyltransferase family A protein [Stellaceae bacterium]
MERSSPVSNVFGSTAKPFFSIVIASVERTDTVATLLDSLLSQRFRDFETIIVDQNPDDRLGPVTDRFQSCLPLQRIRQTVQNASLARNAGARIAAGEWLVFADDDCHYHPETLSDAAAAIESLRPQVLAGSIVYQDGTKLSAYFQGRGALTTLTVLTRLFESCLFFKRDAFLKLGGFDSEFGPGALFHACEGPDLLYRFLRTCPYGAAWFDASIYCFHPRKIPPYDAAAVERGRLYALGRGALAATHPNLANLTLFGASLARNLAYAALFGGTRRVYHLSRIRGFCEGFRRRYRQQAVKT